MRKFRPTQVLATAALILYAGFFFTSQAFYSDADAKLAALLSWSHYGSILPRLPLWYASIGIWSALVIGLLAVALDRRWGARVVLVATLAALALVPFSGVLVLAATARFLGGIGTVCVFSILAKAFLLTERCQRQLNSRVDWSGRTSRFCPSVFFG
jgi:hypothetical protein